MPEGMKIAPAKGKQVAGMYFTMQVSELDCTGCGSCANVCPAKGKALTMVPASEAADTSAAWEYALNLPEVLSAPIREGEVLGSLCVRRGEETLAERPVLAAADVPRLGFGGIFLRLAASLFGL